MKKFFRVLLIALVLFGFEKGIRTQTDGFRFEKILSEYAPRPDWEIENAPLSFDILDQEFTFLGSGVQCYAFLSADEKTVLKVFKHHHFGLRSSQIAKLPLPGFLHRWRDRLLAKRQKRIESIFSSAILAQTTLADQTGVFHLNLNPSEGKYPTVKVRDKIGIAYEFDLSRTPFLLQRKAEAIFPYLDSHKEEARSIIDSLFTCIAKRSSLGIANSDPVVRKNFGILGGKVIEIDVGSFVESPSVQSSLFSKREIFTQTRELKEWVLKNAPEHYDHFEQQLHLAIRS